MYSLNEEEENTSNIGNPLFTAPEQYKSNSYTYKVDSYSIGMIIHFIITKFKYEFIDYDLFRFCENENISKNEKFPKCPKEYDFFLSFYEKCFEILPNSRPSITALIEKIIYNNKYELKRANENELPYIINQLEKYNSIYKISDTYMHDDPSKRSYLDYFLGYTYYSGKYISPNINKAIIQLEKASNQNNSDAQFYLGLIYYYGEYISRDINKSIHYLTLSANQNNSNAQYFLGQIYCKSEFISRNINKSIHYLNLSANQNNSNAQFFLGFIYYNGEYISRDINKSIYYFTLSANQNNSNAQYYLGEIYYLDKYISCDINKSIYYLTLSADQNDSDSQFLLGFIYYIGKYISRDINKSIYYLNLSANQNDSDSQCLLGEIYYDGKYIEKNINKSIHYFKEASCFYDSIAKNYLGIIYKNGDGVEKNIYFAKIYFKEAIKQKEESYSMYNLARIYYFCIKRERKTSKAISLLEKASMKQLSIADLFLFYIFSYCDDINFLNERKSQEYKNKCQNNFSLQMCLINYNSYDNIQNLHNFLRDYDLLNCYDYSYDLLYFLLNGKFYDWKMKIDDNAQANNTSLRKDTNSDFYNGFYD